jgi:MFS family permease
MNIAVPINTRIYRIAVSIFFFVAGLTFATWASRIPDIKEKLQLSDAGLGVVLFALPVGQILSLPISAWLISKFSSRTVTISTAVLYPLTLVVLATAASTFQLVIGLFFFGFWANSLNIAVNTQAIAVEKIYGRSIMASFHGLWSLACFAGAAIASFFVSKDISPLIHFSLVFIASAILVLASYKNTVAGDEGSASSQPLFVKPDSRILILGLIAFCCMLCEGAMADWSGVYFKKVVEAPVSYTTLGYVAFTLTMAGGRFLGDWLVTKYGVKRILEMSGIIITAGLTIAIAFPQLIAATTGFLLVGFGVSSVIPIVYGLAGKSTKMSPSAALAAVSTISFLGFLIGPPVIGFIAELSSLRFSFSVIAVLGLGTTMLASKVKQ